MLYFRNVCQSVINWILAIENDPLGSLERFWSPKKISLRIIRFCKIPVFLANFPNFTNLQCPLESVDEGWHWRHKIFELQIYFYSRSQNFMSISRHNRLITKNRWGGEIILNLSPPRVGTSDYKELHAACLWKK